MKKILVYIGILVIGLILGYLFFGSDSGGKTGDHDHETSKAESMWTCSMHPQIMQPEPGDCPICGMDLIPAENSSEGLAANQFSLTDNAMKLANIQTSIVGEGSGLEGKISLSGKIEINEDKKAVMPAHFNGRIEKLYVKTVGEMVKRGQIVASVYSPELVAAQQELITAAKLKNSQPQLYNAVRKKFNNWMISDAMLDEIVQTGNVRTNWPVHSNVTGTITEIMVEEGSHIQDAMPILKVSNLGTVWAVFDAYESQISNLEEGQTLDIRVNALQNKKLSGKISFIDPILDTDSRTVEVRVILNNDSNKLKPGMFVEAEVDVEQAVKTETLEVPKTAVMWTGERSLVYLKTSSTEPVFEMREVVLGNSSGKTYQVLSGLESGTEIVTNGTFTVDAAAQLQGKNSMMNGGSKANSVPGMKTELSAKFESQFEKSLDTYFELKNALVASDGSKAASLASELKAELENLELGTSVKMLAAHLEKILEMLTAISKSTDLENQRDHFRILSAQIIGITRNMTNIKNELYVQHCPMANSNQGADWLSRENVVRNPYYGDAMLSCGEVTEILK
ncbi:efflux RND transporter periplasmic adaptor subunit [uncultured Christiangramia sp.]|uniref:efflux RND transporter periplasmic adaptor subunit n=1 Tax=Christiangramia sp. 3-2217-3z TaxID=3417564 RepID=UPI0026169D0B|nr:efflux RND transporter periplasmic adaptor subunit [uncultured Christiangramia sp.]